VSAPLWDTSAVREESPTETFAGREAELDALCGAVDSLDVTGARTILIGGEAGIGKTRLVEELRVRARAAGATVAFGVCSPAEGGGLPYAPIVGVLRDLARQMDEPAGIAVLAPARRRLGLFDSPVAEGGLDDPAVSTKTQLFETLLTCFNALAERSRLVIMLEDLHWADSTSIEAIDFMARNLGESPMLLIATYRQEELGRDEKLRRTVAELGRHRAVSQLELTGLDREATAVVMAGVLGRRPEWALLDAVFARCEGNPFFAEELTAARDAAALPIVLRNVIMLRLDRLLPAARHAAAVVAAAGGSIDHRLLAATCDLDDDTLEVAIAEAVELRVLAVEERSRYRFRHALQRDAVDDALLPGERARLHRKLAVGLTNNPEYGAAGPGYFALELAEHWWEANEWAEALTASIRAGDAMAALLAMPEAFANYERAISAHERLDEAERLSTNDAVELWLKAADAAFIIGEPDRSVELANRALAEIDERNSPTRAAVAYRLLGRSCWATGDPDAAFDAFRRARELLPSDPPSIELAGVLAEEARSFLLIAHSREAAARSREAITVARTLGARAEESHALTTLGACLAEQGDPDGGIALIREALAIAEELGLPDILDLAYKLLTHVLMEAARLDEAAQVVFDGIALDGRSVGVRLASAGGNSAESLIRSGRWDEADDLLARMDDRGIGTCVFGPQAVRSLLATRRGRFDEASSRLDRAAELSADLGTVQVRGWFHILRAELALEQGRPAEAYEEIEHGLMVAAGTDDTSYRPEMCALGVRALADEYEAAPVKSRRIDVDKFRRLGAALVEEAGRLVVPVPGSVRLPPRSIAFVALCRAEETRLRTSDPDAWYVAAQGWSEASEPYFVAYCRWREAEATLAGRSGRRRAGAALRDAWRICREIGAPPLQARVESLARRARVTLDDVDAGSEESARRTVAEDLGLTARETEVLAAVARGRTDRQIADELYISKKTVSVHVSNILRKLDVANRGEAAEVAQRAGMSRLSAVAD